MSNVQDLYIFSHRHCCAPCRVSPRLLGFAHANVSSGVHRPTYTELDARPYASASISVGTPITHRDPAHPYSRSYLNAHACTDSNAHTYTCPNTEARPYPDCPRTQ